MKIAPSFPIRSMFGVSPTIRPRWYMLGCIMPMSSPMMKRMLGFVPWAEAGALAIVVAVHNTTRAPQIALNKLMVTLLMEAAEARAAAFAPFREATKCSCRILLTGIMQRARGRTFREADVGRSALDALCGFGSSQICLRVALQRGRRQFTEGSAICHREAPKLKKLVASSDLSHAHS